MLRACSSWIFRSVGYAILTLLPLVTSCPTLVASTVVRAVESLSVAERASLPNTTRVKLKSGRTVSLGVLRSEHRLRLKRFANASKRGEQQAFLLQKRRVISPGVQGTLVPMNFSGGHFQDFYGPFPADYLAFCKAAAVTACLYFSTGTDFLPSGNSIVDIDPLFTDAKLCKSEGGVPDSGGCDWSYPDQYSLVFNPGPPTSQGYAVTHTATCPSQFFNYSVDPHGLVTLNVNNLASNRFSMKSCVVSVFVNK